MPEIGPIRTPEEEEELCEAIAEIDEATLPHGLPRNNWRSIAVRLVISLLFLGILFWRLPPVSIDDVIPEFTTSTILWMVFAVGVHVVAYVLQTLRWVQVSSTLGLHLPFRRMFGYLLAGEFVSNALPTSFGGDVVRVVRQGQETGNFTDAFAATALERLTGWLVLPLLSAIALVIRPDLLQLGGASLAAVVLNITTLVGLVGLLWLAGHPRGAGRLVGRAGWTRYVGAVHLGVLAFRHKPWQVASVLGAGIGFQFLQCVSVLAAARALGLHQVDLIVVMAFFPPTAILQNLPLALGGLGVREGAFVLFFGALHPPVADSQAIALGLLVYAVFIVASLAGAPSFALHRGPARETKSPEDQSKA